MCEWSDLADDLRRRLRESVDETERAALNKALMDLMVECWDATGPMAKETANDRD
jgi:hypothetical protein